MLELSQKGFKSIHNEFQKERNTYLAKTDQRNKERQKLSLVEQKTLDTDFCALFTEIINQRSQEVNLLRAMVGKGAKTTMFDAYELTSNSNFTKAIQQWLEYELEKGIELTDEVAQALEVTIEAGDAYLTNKYYVGNGGGSLLSLIFESYFRYNYHLPNTKKRNDFAEQLVYKIAVQAVESVVFLEDFIFTIGLNYNAIDNNGGEHKNNILRFYSYYFLYQCGPFFQNFSKGPIDDYTRKMHHKQLLNILLFNDGLRHELFNLAETSKGIFSIHNELNGYKAVNSEEVHHLIGILLASSETRKKTCEALQESKWLRQQFLNNPESVFRIARERKILEVFLKKEKKQLQSLRDENDNDLLLHVLQLKGKTEKNIRLLLDHGFSLDVVNNKGVSALSLLNKQRK